MGNQQPKTALVSGKEFKDDPPLEISQFQIFLETYPIAKSSSSELQKPYQFVLKSKQSQSYFFGIKICNNQNNQASKYEPKEISDAVKIFYKKCDGEKEILIFQGCLINGKRSNFGIQYDKKEIYYKGFFKNNKYHGWGVTPNYNGQWVEGKKSGYGYYTGTFQGKTFKYDGMWRGNKFHGFGARNVELKQSKKFLDDQYQPKENSDVDYMYVGQWNDGLKHGSGKLILCKGKNEFQTKQGQFSSDQYLGHRIEDDKQNTVDNVAPEKTMA